MNHKMPQFIPQWMQPKLTEDKGVNRPTGVWPRLLLWPCVACVPLFVLLKDYAWSSVGPSWETWASVASHLCLMDTTKGEFCNCWSYENYQHGIDVIPTITHPVIAFKSASHSVKPWDINPWWTSLCKMWFWIKSKQTNNDVEPTLWDVGIKTRRLWR